jgi:hypothetical protein
LKDFDGHKKGEKHRGGGHKGRRHHFGAQTFRRGRALEFLDRLHVKRTTLKQQLESPEFQEIRQIVLGELKAIESTIDEYTRHFELHEDEKSIPNNTDIDEENKN